MLAISAQARLYLFRGATDMRKSFDGLAGLVQDYFPGQLLSGAVFIFLNGNRTRMKLLYWDNDGFALWYKHLQKGRFYLPENGEKINLDRREFLALLEGVMPLKFTPRFSLKNS